MHMIQLALDPARLVNFVHTHGHSLTADEDHGYATHAWLCATFGDLAPKPFRLSERRSGQLSLLGYADTDGDALRSHAQTFAEPQVLAACDIQGLASKAMPAEWEAGRRFDFEVRVCPVTRGERERDAWLSALDRAMAAGDEPPPRERIYVDWLKTHLGAAAMIDQTADGLAARGRERVRLAGFRRVVTSRRGARGIEHRVERPDALIQGTLRILDGVAFGRLLARGVGRHRAFGFGMLLLKPPTP